MNQATLTIQGMGCDHCVAAVDRSLRGVDGVEVEAVEIGSARISYDPEQVDAERIRQAVKDGGYEVRELNASQ